MFITIKKFLLPACFPILLLGLMGCAKEKKREEMSIQELSQKVTASIEKKRSNDAIAFLEEIIQRFPDHANIIEYRKKLADLYFQEGNYAAAQVVYEHLNQFYPADQQAEYAKYRSILSTYYQTLRADCDQTATEEAIQLCKSYLENKAYTRYCKDIINIQHTCENRLIDKDVYVFNFYLRHQNYDAARIRLKSLKDRRLTENPALEAQLLYLECKLARKEKNQSLVNQNLDKLIHQFPESQYTQMAQALINKNNKFVF